MWKVLRLLVFTGPVQMSVDDGEPKEEDSRAYSLSPTDKEVDSTDNRY